MPKEVYFSTSIYSSSSDLYSLLLFDSSFYSTFCFYYIFFFFFLVLYREGFYPSLFLFCFFLCNQCMFCSLFLLFVARIPSFANVLSFLTRILSFCDWLCSFFLSWHSYIHTYLSFKDSLLIYVRNLYFTIRKFFIDFIPPVLSLCLYSKRTLSFVFPAR